MKLIEGWVNNGDPKRDFAWEEALLRRGEPAWISTSWPAPALVLGRAQRLDEPWVETCPYPVYRRSSGGTAVFHHRDLALSLILPAEHPFAADIRSLYRLFIEIVRDTLVRLGVRVEQGTAPPAGKTRTLICFEDHALESLLFDGKKVFGAAQTRQRKAVMVHGTLLLHLDVMSNALAFGIAPERVEAALGAVPLQAEAVAHEAPVVAAARLGLTLARGEALQSRP